VQSYRLLELRRQSWKSRKAKAACLQGKVLEMRKLHRETPPEIFRKSPLKALGKY